MKMDVTNCLHQDNEEKHSKKVKKKKITDTITETNSEAVNKKSHKRNVSEDQSIVPKKKKKKTDANCTKLEENDITVENNKAITNDKKINSKKEKKSQHADSQDKVKPDVSEDITKEDKEEENSSDEMITEAEAKELNGKSLRSSFASAAGLDALRKFVVVCNENKEKDLAAEYLLAGGNIFEVLKLLDGTDKQISKMNTVFSAVHILLMKILAKYPQYHSAAEQACRYLINSHLSLLHSMISVQSNARQRKTALKLLAAMVSMGGNLPRDLLAHISLQPEVVDSLTEHTKPTDPQNTRTCFIHFILAFLVEGNTFVIRILLDKRGLLSSIFPGLMYDSKEVVNLVLTTVKTYVLENTGISKTMKLHVFSTSVVQNLVSLYNWKGPSNWSKKKKQSVISTPAYLEEKEVVLNIVHEFLITLLTSHRHGIVFHDHTLGTSRVRHNQLISTVLQSLDRPWEHEKPADLVVKIMTACPDLIKFQFLCVESFLEPRLSEKWISVMRFVKKIIESVNADACVTLCSTRLNTAQFANAVISVVFSPIIIKNAIIPALNNAIMTVQYEALILLTTMFHQIKQFLSAVKASYTKDKIFASFHNTLMEYIIKNTPSVELLLNIWNSTCGSLENDVQTNDAPSNEAGSISEPARKHHLSTILDLLHLYNEVCPELLNAEVHVQPSALLNVLEELQDADDEELKTMKVRTIQFLLALDCTEFTPQKKMFGETLSFLTSILDTNMPSTSSYAKATLKTVLNTSGVFEGCTDQIDIWINGFRNLTSSDEKAEVTNWFIHVTKSVVRHTEKYINMIIQAEESTSEENVYIGKIEDVFEELSSLRCTDGNIRNISYLHLQQSTSIPPLLCCALHKMKNSILPSVSSYMSYILIHTLHCQVTPYPLIHLTKDICELPVQKYFESWISKDRVIQVKRIFKSMNTMHKLSKELLGNETLQLSEIFNSGTAISFKYDNESISVESSLSPYEIISLLRMTVFYLTQFIQQGSLTEVQGNNYKRVLVTLLHIAKNDATHETLVEECSKFVFTHPVILQYFSPLHQKRSTVKETITLMIIDICKTVLAMHKKCDVAKLLLPFKDKLLTHLKRITEKTHKEEKAYNVKTVIELLEILQLSPQDIVSLLVTMTKIETSALFLSKDKCLSIYGHVVPQLLHLSCRRESGFHSTLCHSLDAQFVARVSSYLVHLKLNGIKDTDKWETALHEHLSVFPHNIVGIEKNTFTMLLSKEINTTTVKLVSLLISRQSTFIPVFIKYMMKSERIKENNFVFQVLASNLKYKWNPEFLQHLNSYYVNDVVQYLCDPSNPRRWIEENVDAVMYLISSTFDLATCTKICNTVSHIGDKLDAISIQYIRILQSLYIRYANLKADSENVMMELGQVFLHIVTLTLKKDVKNTEKLSTLCNSLINTVNDLKRKRSDILFDALSTSHSWSQFTRFSLKLGLKENVQVPILKTLCVLCDVAYKDEIDNEYAKTVFEMATSHSEFVNIMLSNSSVKRDLIELLWILIRKNKSVILSSHVPVYLAAYNASLSEADQLILLILQYYEDHGVKLHEYRPYLWGNAAATHYSVKGETDTVLWRQPSTSQVLNLFEKEIIDNTLRNYPIHRALKNNKLHDGTNVYDPAFYLPLLCYLLSENNVVACYKVTQSGALALALVACGSTCSDTRVAAYTVISRYYFHLEASRSKEKLLWMRLVDALRQGIVSQQSPLNDLQLSCLVSVFLARTSLVSTQPLHPLYSPLQTFLMAKPALDIKMIPEFFQLFHSSEVQHRNHRHWILENIRDGMKTENDLEVALKCVLFKILLDFYSSILADTRTKKLIVEVIEATTKIQKASLLLVRGYGLLPWLNESVTRLSNSEEHLTDIFISIARNLLDALSQAKDETPHYRFMLLKVLLNVKSHLRTNMSISSFVSYVNCLRNSLLFKSLKDVMSEEDMKELLHFSKELLENVDECESMLQHGCKYAEIGDNAETGDDKEAARNSLKMLIGAWWSHR